MEKFHEEERMDDVIMDDFRYNVPPDYMVKEREKNCHGPSLVLFTVAPHQICMPKMPN